MSGLRSPSRRLCTVWPIGRGSSQPLPRPGQRAKAVAFRALGVALMIIGLASVVPSALAASTTMVNLGEASTYAVLSGASVGNTVSALGAPHTTLRGDLGVKAAAEPTGFPPGVVTGSIRVGTTAAGDAHDDLVAAYTEVAARTGGTVLAGALAGATIGPGLHTIAGAASNTTTVTLDGGGDANAVFVFQIDGALAFAAASHVVLTNGAQASRVFWQVNGAGSIGANADFAGTLMALDAVGVGNGSLVNGRAFARNGALTLDNNQFYSVPPVVTIAGGSTSITTDTTPTISGTTDAEAPAVVSVTINGQTLSSTPSDGVWSVTSAILANGSYPVVASVSDAAGNSTSATQDLTVDTVLPIVVIDGAPSVTTNDPTATIAGTSDVAAGTVVQVTVDAQTVSALVQPGGSWNLRTATLADGTRTVTASVRDPAGNEGTDSLLLTVDTVAPAVTIAGGADALTNDATPGISGTADVAAGTTVTVTLADETLTGLVGSAGGWSVTAAALSDGPHRVVMSVSDAAANQASFTQTLTVDTVAPLVTITGGPTATTFDGDPTIVGTSNAAPGTTVTVTIAGQTMTTLVQANGTWNATPTFVGEGTWAVLASAPDPAGNAGNAEQTLTIASAPAPPPPPPAPAPAPTPAPAPKPAPALAPVPALVPFPPPTERFPAKLQVLRAGVRGGRLDVLARITGRATGGVKLSYQSSGSTTRFTASIRNATVRIDRRLPAAQRRKTTGILTMTYEGNDRVRSDEVRLRAAAGRALLRRGTTRIDDKGRLRVSGTTSGRASGVVRIRLGYIAHDGEVRFLQSTARIKSGKWSLTRALPVDAAKAGGQLSIQYTGYEPRRIRGEQLAKAVTP